MMNEDFVSFEIAKKLKEKGFDESCYQKYDDEGYLSFNHTGYINSEKPCDDFCALAPTIPQVLKWLRDEKEIFVVVFIDDDSDFPVTYNIFNGADCVYHHHGDYYTLSEWSKCELAGIEYVLDNFI